MMSLPARTQVAIAGGGPVGLAAAIELGRRGIETLVVEPRATVTHARPRCKTVNVRSMEHLRRWGIAQRLRDAAPLKPQWSQDIVFCTSLTGHELSRFHGVLGLSIDADRSPELGQQAPQFVLEELLREVVDELETCTLHRGARVTGLDQDDAVVRMHVRDESGADHVVAADYVLGCDGPRSTVRDAIGSSYVGEVALRPNFGIVFRAPELWDRVRHGPCVHYWVVNRQSPGLMGPLDLDGTWWAGVIGVDRETGERDTQSLIAGLVGEPIEAEVTSTDPWTAHMQLVDRMRAGRVFLAGDAAHTMPPNGGFGGNTGVQDAWGLAWKIGLVLKGVAGRGLLDTYDVERRAIGALMVEQAYSRYVTRVAPYLGTDGMQPLVDDFSLEIGCRCNSAAVALEPGEPGEGAPLYEHPRESKGRPGSRAPHVFLDRGGAPVSTLDLFGRGYVLLAGSAGGAWHDVAVAAADGLGLPLDAYVVGSDEVADSDGGFADAYGISVAGAVIVRPDGIVGWRAADGTGASEATMREVLTALLCRNDQSGG
jgi:2-polyprenyl-6-methoxyphenol hydroxylase-like FAD-dependent oxidoreductase